MKKVFAILLAMLLLGTAALAEQDAAIMTVDHLHMEDMGQKMDVQDMQASLVLQNVNDLPSVALLIDGGTEPLLTAVGQLTSKQFSFAIDGMDHGYTAQIPEQQAAQLAQVGDAGLAVMIPNLVPMLDQVVIPALGGVDIPKLDLSELLYAFTTGQGSFEIPYEQVNALLDQMLQVAKAQEKTVPHLDEAIQILEELKNSGTGIAIRGTIDDGPSQKVVANIHLAQDGKVDDEEIARVTVDTRPNDTSVAVAYVQSGFPIDLAKAELTSDPAAQRIDFDLSVIGGASVNFDAFNEDGLSRFVFTIDAAGESGNLGFAYGQQGGNDVLSLTGAFSGAEFAFVINTAMGADGVRTGTMELSMKEGAATDIRLSGDLTLYLGEAVDLSAFTMPADLRPFEQMDENAISQAFAPVTDYLSTHVTMS